MSDNIAKEVVGLVPAAGFATRLGSSTRSKEVVEIGGEPAAGHLLNRFTEAGVRRAVVVLREGKTDVPPALERYSGLQLEYFMVEATPSELHSVAAGLGSVSESTIALGYPDILFEPKGAYGVLLERLSQTGSDLVLGLFPSKIPERVDMVTLDNQLRPVEVVIKQPDQGLRYSWAIAVWGPAFTGSLVRFVAGAEPDSPFELSVGHAVQNAIDSGLDVAAVLFEDGVYYDIGSPGALADARRRHSN